MTDAEDRVLSREHSSLVAVLEVDAVVWIVRGVPGRGTWMEGWRC